jgi:hypothetical protein
MKSKDIKFLEIRYLRGPEHLDLPSGHRSGGRHRRARRLSLEHSSPALRAPDRLPAVAERTPLQLRRAGRLPAAAEEGTWPAHILEHVTLELQNLAGMPGGFGKARETSTRGVYKVVVRAWHEEVTRACLDAGRDLLLAAIQDEARSMSPPPSSAWPTWPSASCSGRAPAASSRRRPPRTSYSGHPPAGHRQPRAARLRRPQPPHLDRRDRPHQRHCRGHLARQGSDQDLAQVLRRAGPRRTSGRECRGCLGCRRGHRSAGGRQAVRRQPRARRVHQSDGARRSRIGLCCGGPSKAAASSSNVTCAAPSIACW